MQSNILILVFVVLQAFSVGLAQSQPSEPRMSKDDYISKYKDHAIREMHVSGVPASITLAQGMLESDYGNSPLAKYANNHFGIKCHKGWNGGTFIQDDDERNECFRKYYSAYDSYRDHSEFLRTRDRYAFLFDLKTTDYQGWAHGLKKAGYATNPKYAHLLIKIIEDNELHQYDLVVKIPSADASEPIAMEEEHDQQPNENRLVSARRVDVSDNNIKYIIAGAGETPESIAERQDMGVWQILKYNDLDKNEVIHQGDVVYLQPKRNNAQVKTHVVSEGETLRDISQKYGVKIKRIQKMNNLSEGYSPKPGEELILRSISKFQAIFTGR